MALGYSAEVDLGGLSNMQVLDLAGEAHALPAAAAICYAIILDVKMGLWTFE